MPSQHTLQIECVQGDIAAQPGFDAVVCAANPYLTSGAGVAGAIHDAAGPGLYREAAPLAPVRTGDAVLTRGHGLPNRHVIHTVGPIFGRDEPAAGLLTSCYRRPLELADQAGIESVAFPAISTGVYGYPVPEAARVSLATVLDVARELGGRRDCGHRRATRIRSCILKNQPKMESSLRRRKREE